METWTRLVIAANLIGLIGGTQNPAIAQLFGSPATATGSLRAVGMDSGTITDFQLSRLNHLAPGQSIRAMRHWASIRHPGQVAVVDRYPAFTDGKSADLYGLESQPGMCVRVRFSAGVYVGYNFEGCPQ